MSYLGLEEQSTKFTDHAVNQVFQETSLSGKNISEAETCKQSFTKMVTNSLLREPTKSNLNNSHQGNVKHAGAVSDENISQVQPSLHRPAVLNETIREAVQSAVHQQMRKKEVHWTNIVVRGVFPAGDGDCQ